MTIYYTAVFVILVVEMVAFGILVVPLPSRWRRTIHRFVSRSPLVLQAITVLKFVFGFIFLLFIDAVNRLQRLDQGDTEEKRQFHDAGYEASQKANKFYAQRNLYLTGFTLFLSLILERTSTLVVAMLKHEEELEYAREEHKTSSKDQERLLTMEKNYKDQIEALEKEKETLRLRKGDMDNLKKQIEQQTAEYHQLSVERNLLPVEKKSA
ncbi:B-cell receptor-associated protein 31-like-domain-containing protein [Mucor mucedo]|uniref:B-cell receptor-associated protein 31-like-domain-containing protein n=1 Tax=Mucor mucedo TaxID=29922 RepID=UPI00221EDF61|nr:B-cell receptor-associated protein 31-like-domain-containing protein [Mucor mucedo]KAI7892296.1 B-cell receptor-associated protein 31-like-domain-containing protein [Mucor mucedo]